MGTVLTNLGQIVTNNAGKFAHLLYKQRIEFAKNIGIS